ncbi:MAG: DUF3253 domain-containing protein, partial [Pseudomonadota bacterium]
TDREIRAALLSLATARAPKTFCPSEVARALADDWRPLMPRVRELARAEGLIATQRGAPVDAVTARGPIRLSL